MRTPKPSSRLQPLPEDAPKPKHPKKTIVEDDDVITVKPTTPIASDDEVLETEPQELIAPQRKGSNPADSAAVEKAKKVPRPFLKARQVPTTDIKDQVGEFRFTDGVDFKDEGNKVIANVKLGDYVTIPIPNKKAKQPVFLVVIIFRRYNAEYFRASVMELDSNGVSTWRGQRDTPSKRRHHPARRCAAAGCEAK